MKKKFYLLGMLAAGLTFAGCTDDIDDATGSGVVEGATGYVKVAVNLPTTSGNSTRGTNDNFDDGLAKEYQVKDGIIAFFVGNIGESEENATFVKAENLGVNNWNTHVDNPNQITTQKVTVLEAPTVAADKQLYALVILNTNGEIQLKNGSLKWNGEGDFFAQAGGSAQLNNIRIPHTQTIDKFIGGNEKGAMMMTNSPIAVGGSPSYGVQTLVPVTVYKTWNEAEGALQSDQIFVERVVSKATLSGFNQNEKDGPYTISVKTENSFYKDDVVTLKGWILNATNKSTKLVRDVTGFTTWQTYKYGAAQYCPFVGSVPIIPSIGYYRIYWALDPNYNSHDVNSFHIYNQTNEGNITWNESCGDEAPLYCLENTMNVDEARSAENTITWMLLKTTYKHGSEEAGTSFYVIDNMPMTAEDLIDYMKKQLGTGYENLTLKDETEEVLGGYIDTEDEVKKIFSIGKNALSDEQAKAIVEKFSVIKYYKYGTSYYYAARIKHFGGTYSDLDPRDPNVSGASDENALGYYGMVRNNWYDVHINSISGPGEPEIPEIPTDNYGYINAQINILSWAKRSQNVDL